LNVPAPLFVLWRAAGQSLRSLFDVLNVLFHKPKSPPTPPRSPVRSALSLPKPLSAGRHLGVRLDPELEASLQLVAAQTGSSVSACVRRALRLYLRPFRDGEECRRQSRLVARWEASDAQLARLPRWNDWTP